MFIKDKQSMESYTHICEDKTEKQMKNKAIEVRLHDIHTFTFVKDDKGVHINEPIKFCPYCGCDLEKDAFENKQSESYSKWESPIKQVKPRL